MLFSRADRGGLLYRNTRLPVWLTWAIGLVNFLFAIPAYWLIESHGRRWLVLRTLPLLFLTMVAIAGSFQIGGSEPDEGETTVRRILIGILTVLFTVFYSPGLGPVPFTLSAELFPLEYRMVGMSMAVALNLLLGGLINLFVPLVLNANKSILLASFAVMNIIAWVAVYYFVREPVAAPLTDGLPSTSIRLEEVCEIYKTSRSQYFKLQKQYKQNQVHPWWHFLCRQETPPSGRHSYAGRHSEQNDASGERQHETNEVPLQRMDGGPQQGTGQVEQQEVDEMQQHGLEGVVQQRRDRMQQSESRTE